MIAYCLNPDCGLVFDNPNLTFGGSGHFTIRDVGTKCPKCKHTATFLEGTFEYDRGKMVGILSAPQFTRDIIDRLKIIAEKAINHNFTFDEIEKEVKENNTLLNFIREWLPKDNKQLRIYLAWLLTIIIPIVYDLCKSDSPPTINNYTTNTINFYYPSSEKQNQDSTEADQDSLDSK